LRLDDHGLAVADHDLLAGDRLEVGGEVTCLAFLVNAGLVVLSAQIVEASRGVRQQVVDDDQDRVAGRDERFQLPRRRAMRR